MNEDLRDFLNFIKLLGFVCVGLAAVIFTCAVAVGLAFKILEAL